MPAERSGPLLAFEDVRKVFRAGLLGGENVVALDDFSLTLEGESPRIVSIAGESGSGKTTLARLGLGLLRPTAGTVRYRGRSLDALRAGDRLAFRREVQAVFQDPYSAYNPFYRVDHVFQVLIRTFGLARDERAARALVHEALAVVGLAPRDVLGRHPHELSGGQAQRVMIARAFLPRPRLVIADEPVSMIDASLRRTVLEAMRGLKEAFGISFLYITHDLATAYEVSDELLVLQRGRVVERGSAADVFASPAHAYTARLIAAIPIADPERRLRPRPAPAREPAGLGART